MDSQRIFLDCLKHGYSGWLYEQDGKLVGYAMMMFVLDEMHLLNICIRPDGQGKGLGSRLLKTLERIARSANAETCFLEVRQSNFSAIRLYLNAGFNEVGYAQRLLSGDFWSGRCHCHGKNLTLGIVKVINRIGISAS